jgi:MBOAT, membrane-bound O-acyltransferase family
MTIVVPFALAFIGLGHSRWVRIGLIALAMIAVAVAPAVVPGPARFVRFLLGLVSVTLFVKFYDLAVGVGRPGASRPTFLSYIAFLNNWFGHVYRKRNEEPRPPASADRARLVRGGLGLVAGITTAFLVFRADWSGSPLAVEHVVKVLMVFAILLPFDLFFVAVFRLSGGWGRQVCWHPYASRTPADFWRRYNRPVTHLFYEDIFIPSGGRSAPFRATMAAFAFSALIHEYLFAVALWRVEGFQTAFFLIQGLAVAATRRLRPVGAWAVVGIGATSAFDLITSLLFFASLGGVLPFYAEGRPWWLRPRI